MLESRSAYGYYGASGGYTGETVPPTSTRMSYREYKTRWADHKTVPGSYDEKDKSIRVIFTNEEMKAKTNLGNRYHLDNYYFRFGGTEIGIASVCDFKAKTRENAEKNARKYAREMGYSFEGAATWQEYAEQFNRRKEN